MIIMGKAKRIRKILDTLDTDYGTDTAKEISGISNDENQNDVQPSQNIKIKTRKDILREKILERYKKKEGLQLYLRFPHKLPETEEDFQKKVKELSPLIVGAHKPRQNYARFCLIDFRNKNDRDAALKDFRQRIESGELLKHVVHEPRTENKEFIQELIERKIRNHEKKRLKLKIKKDRKKFPQEANFTTSVTIKNLPLTITATEIRALFPNAVDVQIKSFKRNSTQSPIATVLFPTTFEAHSAIKRHLSLHGKPIRMYFNSQRKASSVRHKEFPININ